MGDKKSYDTDNKEIRKQLMTIKRLLQVSTFGNSLILLVAFLLGFSGLSRATSALAFVALAGTIASGVMIHRKSAQPWRQRRRCLAGSPRAT